MEKKPVVEAPALIVVTCEGPQLYVSKCPFCSSTHWHSGCLVPMCSRCAYGKQMSFFGGGISWDCDPRKTVAVNETWGGKKFCDRRAYHLTLVDGSPRYAPGHEKNACARAIAHYLETLGMGATVEWTVNVRPDANWHCARCPPCINRRS
jgi:hypothetical protein